MKVGPKSSLRPFLHRALHIYKTLGIYEEYLREKIEGERAQNAHNTQVQGELKVGKLYFHNNSGIMGFLRNG